jgi:nicotinamide-nucleotide amidase
MSMWKDEGLYLLAEQLGRRLSAAGARLALAESCTGGWICECVTEVPGCSAWFDRGYVTYSNAAKVEMLGVGNDLLEQHGAVSQNCVEAMVAGALNRSLANYAVAVSGIAGPDGATPGKPVGTVWLAWEKRSESCSSRLFHFTGTRKSIRQHAVREALLGLLERI